MPSAHVPLQHAPVVEIDPRARTLVWHSAEVHLGQPPRTLPWFPGVGALDYARARSGRRGWRRRPCRVPATAPVPTYGDPLIVRTDLAAVFWLTGTLLCSAPIRRRRVAFADAAPVDWSADDGEFVVIENNLCQLTALPTLDPPLHVLRVDTSGRLSVALLVADTDGSPVIGPATHHDQPWAVPQDRATGSAGELARMAGEWQDRLSRGDRQGYWRMLAGQDALEALAAAGFTVAGEAGTRPGLPGSLFAATGQWTTGWYAGTRLLTLARFHPSVYGGDLHYGYHAPGSRPVAVAAGGDRFDDGDLVGYRGPADVETWPADQRVYVEVAHANGARMISVPAGRVALMEPTLLEGPLPPLGDDPRWVAWCRRCGAPMTSGDVGPDWVPYVHGLFATSGDSTWCAAHPDTVRRRPHAPVCRVADRRTGLESSFGLMPAERVVPF